MGLQNICFNAVGVALLIAQGCQAIVQVTLGLWMVCVEQRHRFVCVNVCKIPGVTYDLWETTPSVLRFLSVIRHLFMCELP